VGYFFYKSILMFAFPPMFVRFHRP